MTCHLSLLLSLFPSLFQLHRIDAMILVTHETPESFYIIILRRVIKKDSPIGREREGERGKERDPSTPSGPPPNQVNGVIDDISR